MSTQNRLLLTGNWLACLLASWPRLLVLAWPLLACLLPASVAHGPMRGHLSGWPKCGRTVKRTACKPLPITTA
jgi:hypothetical protein